MASSGFTRGIDDNTVLVSWRATFAVAFPALSFFNFFMEEPCFPTSMDLFWTQYQFTSEFGVLNFTNYWSKLKLLITLLSSISPALLSPCLFSESDSRPPVFSRRSSSESSSNYERSMELMSKGNLLEKEWKKLKEKKNVLPTVFLFDWRDQLSHENSQQWWQPLCHQMRS